MSSPSWKFQCVIAITVGVVLALPSFARAADYSGSYLCIEEFGGGGYYFAERNGWGGTVFRADNKFVIKLQKDAENPAYAGATATIADYSVTVSEFGAQEAVCFGRGDAGQVLLWSVETTINCSANSDYWVDFASMRYLRAYPYGFLDHAEDNANTPGMFGGSCAKIN